MALFAVPASLFPIRPNRIGPTLSEWGIVALALLMLAAAASAGTRRGTSSGRHGS